MVSQRRRPIINETCGAYAPFFFCKKYLHYNAIGAIIALGNISGFLIDFRKEL